MVARSHLLRFLLLLICLLFLILGLLAGAVRLGWDKAWVQPTLGVIHGPLMICGFLGTLIGLERAVALGRRWGYAAPVLALVGMLSLVAGHFDRLAMFLVALGSLVLVFIFITVLLKQPTFHTTTMSLGAVAWLVGNVLWSTGVAIPHMAHWWIAFLILTILGERLELNRLVAPSRHGKFIFGAGLVLLAAGLICESLLPGQGDRIAGVGLLALAVWLAFYDVARFTVHRAGLPRFIALCLFAGYGWLGIAGLIWVWAAPVDARGSFSFFLYDAMLHSVLLGFVFSMIFAHAPIIFPAVLARPLPFRPAFYAHALLLHLSLAARIAGDLAGSLSLVRWSGLGNVIALILFLANSGYSVVTGQSRNPPSPS